MKSYYLLTFVLFGGGLLKPVYTQNDFEDQQLRAIEQSSTFEMFQDFRQPKRILFSCTRGGSSHVHWVISILNELDSRGHNTSFLTKVNNIKQRHEKYTNIDSCTRIHT
jgi:hypothetical protein